MRYFCVLVLAVLVPGLAMAEQSPDLRAMLGQMLMVGFRGTSLDESAPILRDIRQYHLGGVILFDRDAREHTWGRNIASPAQVRNLTAQLRGAASIPLFIAVDQEGGKVCRLKETNGFIPLASAKTLGQGSPEITQAQALATGNALADLGINMNFAPVVDVDVNPRSPAIGALERSYSADPHLVAAHAQAMCRGLAAAGVLPCLKHFPGHGSASADSHHGLTDITQTWSPRELIPYEILIPLKASPCIMVGHLFLRQFDSDAPATLSPAILTTLLRQRLGFQGVIISDDMQMRAITDQYGLEHALVRAVQAGVDILVFGNNLDYDPDIVPKALDILEQAVRDGRLTAERIAQSYARISALKKVQQASSKKRSE
ncbi:glycoside hydrolase family 3 protein [Desulfovibrionales bacterium]